MKALVIGRTGQVARALVAGAACHGIDANALGRGQIDLFDRDALSAAMNAHRPAIVFNAAAYTAVDQAETDQEAAFALNARAPGLLAEAAQSIGAHFIHISTDYVFSGAADRAYREEDETDPINVYGATKKEGEIRVLDAAPDAAIVRTSWVFDAAGRNFLRTMLRLAQTRPTLRVVADQMGSPTYAADLADALWRLAGRMASNKDARGVFHFANSGATSWFGFAEHIFERARALGGPAANVEPITTSQYPTPARRPMNSRLDCGKIASVLGVAAPDWRDAVENCLKDIAAEGWRVE